MSFMARYALQRWFARPLSRPASTTVVMLGLAAGIAHAQAPDPNTWVTNGEVHSIATAGNTIYLGGSFTNVGPNTGHFVGIGAETGQRQTGWPRVVGDVYCSAADGAGGWYIGGSLKSVGGVPRANVAHIRADMTLDAWDPGADGPVYALTVSGATIYAGGYFFSIGGQPRRNIAALDAATGLATQWEPWGIDGGVQTLAVSGSTVYAGGYFSSVDGQSRKGLAALDATTGLVTAWNPMASGDDDYPTIQALAVNGSTVYAGGNFTSIGGQSRKGLAALDATTGLSTAWNPGASNGPWSTFVCALAVSGSTVYAGGGFTSIGGQSRSNIAALNVTTGLATTWNPNASNTVMTLVVSGATVYAGGYFKSIGGQNRNYIAALDASTGVPTAWNPEANALVLTVGVSGATVCAGGVFSSIGGQDRNGIAALDATTGLPTAWNPSANGPNGAGVSALAVSGSTVYAGGLFTSIGGQSRSNLAALDATTGLATAWNPGPDSTVCALAVSGSTVYAGGSFANIGGQGRRCIAALDVTAGLATAWNPAASGGTYGTYVDALAASGSMVYVSGCFTSIGGQSRSHLAALDTATGLATTWDPAVTGGTYTHVDALALSGSTVYVGGVFTGIGGQIRSNLAALDVTTGLATAWNPGADYSVNALAVSGSTVYVGGYFTSIGGQNRNYIAALDASTGVPTAWNPGAWGNGIYALVVSGSTVYSGGAFTSIGGLSDQGFAALRPDESAPAVQVLSPNGSSPLLIGTKCLLSWSATDNLAVQSVDLYLSRTGLAGPWELLAAAVPNTGSYPWDVAGPEVVGNNAYFLVVARDYGGNLGADISDSGFTISSEVLEAGPGCSVIAVALSPPAPNPATHHAVVTYAVPSRTHVHLSLLDVLGREVAVYTDGIREAGRYTAALETTDLHAGMYFVRMRAKGVNLTRRLAVVK